MQTFITLRLSAFLGVFALALGLIPNFANAQESESLTTARTAVAEKRFARAWEELLKFHAENPENWRTQEALIREAATGLNLKANSDVTSEPARPEEALKATDLLTTPESIDLVEKVFPGSVDGLKNSVRQIQGTAWWRIGQRSRIRGQVTEAEQNYRTALTFLQEGDLRYPSALNDFASLILQLGIEQKQAGKGVDAEFYLNGALGTYEALLKAVTALGDERMIAETNRNLAIVRKELSIVLPSPTPTPSPVPTPEPSISNLFGGANYISEFFARVGSDTALRNQLLLWIGIIFGLITVYWIVPGVVLMVIANRGDITAAELRPKVKYLGIFTLFTYFATSMTHRVANAEKKKKVGCPHCGFPLDDPFSYEDLVFSRCPKCKGQITPLFTVEGLITLLSNSVATDVEKVNMGLSSMDKFVERDTMVRLVRALLTLAVRRRASDLHVEPDESHLVIRQRIDGMMTEMVSLPRSLGNAVVSAIKVQANLNIAERRLPQDGKLSMQIDKAEIDIRVATSPSGAGEKCSMRLLDCRSIQMETRHLGMSPRGQEIFTRAISSPHGLVLVAGPTGSGKTTTLYVGLQSLKTGAKNIISIEDPIEFRIPGVNQIQVNTAQGLTFAACLRSILRQDPDVIMVGEIRDKETAEISVNAATTGHLVFSTLHTIDSASSVARLMDLGVGPRQFADALSLVVAQRLSRLVCQSCKEPVDPTPDQLTELGIKDPPPNLKFMKGKGCVVCNQTGYFRRQGIFEFLEPSERLRGAIENQKLSTHEIRDICIQAGMRSMRQESIDMLLAGMTTVEETLRVTK